MEIGIGSKASVILNHEGLLIFEGVPKKTCSPNKINRVVLNYVGLIISDVCPTKSISPSKRLFFYLFRLGALGYGTPFCYSLLHTEMQPGQIKTIDSFSFAII